jgi:hypothetical protein
MIPDATAPAATARPLEVPRGFRWTAAGLLAVGAAALVLGLRQEPERAWAHVLLGNFYVLSLALAGALFVSIHYLSGAGWSAGLRRVPEAMMSVLPVAALLVLALFLGRHVLYEWSRPGALAGSSAGKAAYFSTPFVLLRMLVVLSAWVLLTWRMRTLSRRQDEDASLVHHRSMVRQAAVFTVVFAFSFSLASFDWLMSLDPHWFSTIFAVYVFAGLFLLGLATITLVVTVLHERGHLGGVVGKGHLHDLGKLVFAFSTFWAYIWLCQYLLIWYGNIPEEVTHYLRRTRDPWLGLFLVNPVLNWVVPFVLLLPRAAKRSPTVLKAVCLVVLAGRWLDLYLVIMPELRPRPALGALELLTPLAYAGLFAWLMARALSRAPLVPVNDPYLGESIAHCP